MSKLNGIATTRPTGPGSVPSVRAIHPRRLIVGDAMDENRPRQPPPLPRLIRFRDAPRYLGMDRNRFNAEVRPLVTEVSIGKQGIAFDRLELDTWVDDYLACNGRPGRSKGVTSWDANETPASRGGQDVGSSTSTSAAGVFARALEQLNLKKRNDTSHE